jgi:hypothetical protein
MVFSVKPDLVDGHKRPDAHGVLSSLPPEETLRTEQPATASDSREIARKLRKIAGSYVAQHYPTTIAAGAIANAVGASNGELWSIPLVYATPGYGDDDVVGPVGSLTVHAHKGEVIEATPRAEAIAALRKLHEANREAIEAAFHPPRAT